MGPESTVTKAGVLRVDVCHLLCPAALAATCGGTIAESPIAVNAVWTGMLFPQSIQHVFRDPLRWVRRVADDNFLRGDHRINRFFAFFNIKHAVVPEELEEIDGRQIACAVVQVHVFTAIVNNNTICNKMACDRFRKIKDFFMSIG